MTRVTRPIKQVISLQAFSVVGAGGGGGGGLENEGPVAYATFATRLIIKWYLFETKEIMNNSLIYYVDIMEYGIYLYWFKLKCWYGLLVILQHPSIGSMWYS